MRRTPLLRSVTLLAITLSATADITHADEKVNAEEIMKGITSSFDIPFRDLYKKKYDSEWYNLLDGLSGSFSFSYPLKDTVRESRGADGIQRKEDFRKTTLTASASYNPLSYWYAAGTLYGYMDLEAAEIFSTDNKADWNPDFTYSFGYSDWHPFTFSLVYSNYGANRINPDKSKGEQVTNFNEGTFSLGWKYTLPRFIEELFIVHSSGGIGGSINYNLTPKFQNLDTSSEESWKQTVTLSAKYTIYKSWYFAFSLYYYPKDWQQQPWNPDFTYSFGNFNWRPGSFSLEYNNYSGNRFPWNEVDNSGSFKDGSISLSWRWKF
jgi:hypothetical protein